MAMALKTAATNTLYKPKEYKGGIKPTKLQGLPTAKGYSSNYEYKSHDNYDLHDGNYYMFKDSSSKKRKVPPNKPFEADSKSNKKAQQSAFQNEKAAASSYDDDTLQDKQHSPQKQTTESAKTETKDELKGHKRNQNDMDPKDREVHKGNHTGQPNHDADRNVLSNQTSPEKPHEKDTSSKREDAEYDNDDFPKPEKDKQLLDLLDEVNSGSENRPQKGKAISPEAAPQKIDEITESSRPTTSKQEKTKGRNFERKTFLRKSSENKHDKVEKGLSDNDEKKPQPNIVPNSTDNDKENQSADAIDNNKTVQEEPSKKERIESGTSMPTFYKPKEYKGGIKPTKYQGLPKANGYSSTYEYKSHDNYDLHDGNYYMFKDSISKNRKVPPKKPMQAGSKRKKGMEESKIPNNRASSSSDNYTLQDLQCPSQEQQDTSTTKETASRPDSCKQDASKESHFKKKGSSKVDDDKVDNRVSDNNEVKPQANIEPGSDDNDNERQSTGNMAKDNNRSIQNQEQPSGRDKSSSAPEESSLLPTINERGKTPKENPVRKSSLSSKSNISESLPELPQTPPRSRSVTDVRTNTDPVLLPPLHHGPLVADHKNWRRSSAGRNQSRSLPAFREYKGRFGLPKYSGWCTVHHYDKAHQYRGYKPYKLTPVNSKGFQHSIDKDHNDYKPLHEDKQDRKDEAQSRDPQNRPAVNQNSLIVCSDKQERRYDNGNGTQARDLSQIEPDFVDEENKDGKVVGKGDAQDQTENQAKNQAKLPMTPDRPTQNKNIKKAERSVDDVANSGDKEIDNKDEEMNSCQSDGNSKNDMNSSFKDPKQKDMLSDKQKNESEGERNTLPGKQTNQPQQPIAKESVKGIIGNNKFISGDPSTEDSEYDQEDTMSIVSNTRPSERQMKGEHGFEDNAEDRKKSDGDEIIKNQPIGGNHLDNQRSRRVSKEGEIAEEKKNDNFENNITKLGEEKQMLIISGGSQGKQFNPLRTREYDKAFVYDKSREYMQAREYGKTKEYDKIHKYDHIHEYPPYKGNKVPTKFPNEREALCNKPPPHNQIESENSETQCSPEKAPKEKDTEKDLHRPKSNLKANGKKYTNKSTEDLSQQPDGNSPNRQNKNPKEHVGVEQKGNSEQLPHEPGGPSNAKEQRNGKHPERVDDGGKQNTWHEGNKNSSIGQQQVHNSNPADQNTQNGFENSPYGNDQYTYGDSMDNQNVGSQYQVTKSSKPEDGCGPNTDYIPSRANQQRTDDKGEQNMVHGSLLNQPNQQHKHQNDKQNQQMEELYNQNTGPIQLGQQVSPYNQNIKQNPPDQHHTASSQPETPMQPDKQEPTHDNLSNAPTMSSQSPPHQKNEPYQQPDGPNSELVASSMPNQQQLLPTPNNQPTPLKPELNHNRPGASAIPPQQHLNNQPNESNQLFLQQHDPRSQPGAPNQSQKQTPAQNSQPGVPNQSPHQTPAQNSQPGAPNQSPQQMPTQNNQPGALNHLPHQTLAQNSQPGAPNQSPHQTPAQNNQPGAPNQSPHQTPAQNNQPSAPNQSPHQMPAQNSQPGAPNQSQQQIPAQNNQPGAPHQSPHQMPAQNSQPGAPNQSPQKQPAQNSLSNAPNKFQQQLPARTILLSVPNQPYQQQPALNNQLAVSNHPIQNQPVSSSNQPNQQQSVSNKMVAATNRPLQQQSDINSMPGVTNQPSINNMASAAMQPSQQQPGSNNIPTASNQQHPSTNNMPSAPSHPNQQQPSPNNMPAAPNQLNQQQSSPNNMPSAPNQPNQEQPGRYSMSTASHQPSQQQPGTSSIPIAPNKAFQHKLGSNYMPAGQSQPSWSTTPTPHTLPEGAKKSPLPPRPNQPVHARWSQPFHLSPGSNQGMHSSAAPNDNSSKGDALASIQRSMKKFRFS